MAEDSGNDAAGGGRGLVLGKFMPPHRGHELLVRFAHHFARELTVLVCSLEREPIPGPLRYEWMREMFPRDRVVHVTDDLPQQPADSPHFWDLWREVIRREAGAEIEFVFASEAYGWKLAETLGARYVPFDHARAQTPVSGTQIRSDPMRHWEHIPECVRPHFVKRVCVFGPESTGKSTLAAELARHYNTVHVWEYARPLLDFNGGRCERAHIPVIARGQAACEDALARRANRVLICDTDVLTTTIWSDVLFGDCPPAIRELASARRYDLYLLLDVDVPWVDDRQRFLAEAPQRQAFLDRCRRTLEAADRPFTVISGSWSDRFARAVAAIDSACGLR